jgi:3D (Asp-Asp-Asp) domain-containing protein
LTLYNYADHKGPKQADCFKYFPALSKKVLARMNQTRFLLSKAPYGYGVKNWHLVPYRTIAVDKNTLPYGSLIFIPAARGQKITPPGEQPFIHDGYFYAADTGGAIKKNHIDVFLANEKDNVFPRFIKSRKEKSFEAYLISNPHISNSIAFWHGRH